MKPIHPAEVMSVEKRRVIKDDGRYLIFYSFSKQGEETGVSSARAQDIGAADSLREAAAETKERSDRV